MIGEGYVQLCRISLNIGYAHRVTITMIGILTFPCSKTDTVIINSKIDNSNTNRKLCKSDRKLIQHCIKKCIIILNCNMCMSINDRWNRGKSSVVQVDRYKEVL